LWDGTSVDAVAGCIRLPLSFIMPLEMTPSMRWYRVTFETDRKTKRVTAKLPTLNNTADYGASAEEALSNLRELAQGFLEVLRDTNEPLPPSDRTEAGGVYLSLPIIFDIP
jgi:predicted RNase H-like HicB family nuclease